MQALGGQPQLLGGPEGNMGSTDVTMPHPEDSISQLGRGGDVIQMSRVSGTLNGLLLQLLDS